MTGDDAKWFLTEVAPYASLFMTLVGLLIHCYMHCEKWKDDE
jgi:hypothetical protein